MPDLILTTFDWVPKAPRAMCGTCARWALEEAGLPYRVGVPIRWRILLRQTERHWHQDLTVTKPPKWTPVIRRKQFCDNKGL